MLDHQALGIKAGRDGLDFLDRQLGRIDHEIAVRRQKPFGIHEGDIVMIVSAAQADRHVGGNRNGLRRPLPVGKVEGFETTHDILVDRDQEGRGRRAHATQRLARARHEDRADVRQLTGGGKFSHVEGQERALREGFSALHRCPVFLDREDQLALVEILDRRLAGQWQLHRTGVGRQVPPARVVESIGFGRHHVDGAIMVLGAEGKETHIVLVAAHHFSGIGEIGAAFPAVGNRGIARAGGVFRRGRQADHQRILVDPADPALGFRRLETTVDKGSVSDGKLPADRRVGAAIRQCQNAALVGRRQTI